jgi:hypothetical protein
MSAARSEPLATSDDEGQERWHLLPREVELVGVEPPVIRVLGRIARLDPEQRLRASELAPRQAHRL